MTQQSIHEMYDYLTNLKLTNEQAEIARLILKEINSRLDFF